MIEDYPNYCKKLPLGAASWPRFAPGDGAAEQGCAFLLIEDISLQKRQERLLVDYNQELEKQLQEQSAQLKAANARLEDEIREHMQDKMILRESERRYACFVAAILNLGGLLSGSAPHREDLPGTTMIPKRPAAKFDPADLAV